ncbi:hypothetical protein [Streptomyces sp. NPDC001966]
MTQSDREQRDAICVAAFALRMGFRRSWQNLRAHRAPAFLTDTVILCATARHAQGDERSAALEKISKRMRPVERIVRNARRVRMLSLPRSRRQEAAKHAHMVIRGWCVDHLSPPSFIDACPHMRWPRRAGCVGGEG